jgi:hypothetical protein
LILSALIFVVADYRFAGFPSRLPHAVVEDAAVAQDINPRRAACDRPSIKRLDAGDVCRLGDDGQAPQFALLGDSFGDALMPGVDVAARADGMAGYALTVSGCAPLVEVSRPKGDGSCEGLMQHALRFLETRPDVKKIIIVARWTAIVSGRRFGAFGGDQSFYMADSLTKKLGAEENQQVLERALTRMADLLPGRQIIVLAYLPEQRVDVPYDIAMRRLRGLDLAASAVPRSVYDQRQAPVRQVMQYMVKSSPNVHVVDVGGALCGPAVCDAEVGGRPRFADDNHISRTTAVSLAPELERALRISSP